VSSPDAAAKPSPVEGLYAFVRGHLTPANQIVAGSATLVAFVDFMSPRLWMAPRVVYSFTAAVLALMLVAGLAPRATARALSAIGFGPVEAGSVPLWRRPAWQFGVALLLGVSALGWASLAKATQGGLIASQFPAARSLQESLLGLRRDVADIKQGVDAANGKLDVLIGDSRDPRKDLVASGYLVNDSGLMGAVKQGDRRAAALFARIGYSVMGQGPMSVILTGEQPWDGALVAELPRSMFAAPSACVEAGVLLNYPLRPPAAERVAAFKRLCGADRVVAMLRQNIAQDQLTPSPNEQWTRYRDARKANLALLTQQ
jgi:hypothetical protein